MNTISTWMFEFDSPAPPEQVWAALTQAELTARYFFGMTVTSQWQPGGRVVFTPDAERAIYGRLEGEVLVADEGRRLSYTLGSGDAHPTTYVTWEIGEGEGEKGSRVRLAVDETFLPPRSDEDAHVRRSWSRVTAALQDVLAGLPLP